MSGDLPPIPGLNPALATLPDKFRQLRPNQLPAIMDILEHFDNGERVVVLDAPVGSGKTCIAEIVRLMLAETGSYVCHSKDLQVQFSGDFPYSPILWGRANYLPEYAAVNPGATCADCQREKCDLCESSKTCPYQAAKDQAAGSPIPVLNSAYWLSETIAPKSTFARRGLVVFDEADTLEQVLLGQISVTVTAGQALRYRVDPPDRLTKEDSYAAWARSTETRLVSVLRDIVVDPRDPLGAHRRRLSVTRLLQRVRGMAADLDAGGAWVYTGGAGSDRRRGELIEFRPVEVARYGEERIWSRDSRFLLMSGTVISPGMMLESLGWEKSYGYVRVDSSFPARNRPVIIRPVAEMTKVGLENGAGTKMVKALRRVLDDHPDDRILVHTVSYRLAQDLADGLGGASNLLFRPVITYTEGAGRGEAVERFKSEKSAVLLAPSLDRGIDLPDDLCRVIVIAKIPFGNLGDKQIAKRLYGTPNGEVWYNVMVARVIQQMCGRGMRHDGDQCSTYVLDSVWCRWYRRWARLMPAWWRQAVRVETEREG